ncbi:G-D-S-L family lipolytic protein [uncultured Algibacter sp.]|uniref:G-D-S-L family lipolytic protein n=1 Tax=uncultured Algibacter sp. TaxID=298659 RepID=UPI00262E4C5E|nr:G-D-S-L family lipolytic protein [uncultured Algibacter sp.]
MNTKYIVILLIFMGVTACNSPEDVLRDNNIPIEEDVQLPALIAGEADFSKYVSVGNSLTSGLSDGTVFLAAQEKSFPKILSEKFALIGGGEFTQPLVSDNNGGLALNGTRIASPRFAVGQNDCSGDPTPKRLDDIIGPVTVSTDIVLNNPTGPFNNMGVPLAKSFHLLAPGYGNIANFPTAANPYFIRMTGSTPNASVLELSMAQAPTFFSLWIGNNDVLGYATSGGDGSNPITPVDGPPGVGFNQTYGAIIATLTSGGAKGIVANIPYVTDIAHFTTVTWDALDPTDECQADLAEQIPQLNAQLYGILKDIFTAYGEPDRVDLLTTDGPNPLLIYDETLKDLSEEIRTILSNSPEFALLVQSFGLPVEAVPLVAGLFGNAYGTVRQTNENDLLVLTSGSIIGTVNEFSSQALQGLGLSKEVADQFSVEGITLPLIDKWVLLPSEQSEIKMAIDNFNTTIETAATQAGLAFVDANALLTELSTTGITSNNFTLTSGLITGGAFSLDGVHLTSRGYALVANEFMKAIDATYGSNFEASGNLVDIGTYPTNYSPLLPPQ